ncbi:NADH-quinone oxidoreductase subunit M [Kingella kingae]|uniref:NADH-quinone oxidoreductase subunit M n=1 Tax=Kingella kingae TaxID=504 RepID=UPI00025850EE|nr:NADH-quinone oxidoreductase subunit M [Kingella kingae]EIC12680.1 NADH:ubiquinone oxidoreductase subunit M [Kingella kingae PYKK081]MDK4568426.1 NADH-quinone oxidoreductase subunit M [Kingella kingae]MDK4570389.1 NADH-quinone oxidoreductase subunit M [Kingella kingae]MDK4572326.1 NADH-quinone oxidoreductase subunit M [Kingella kingae]MDK4598577.1 NADH-quinone oxidoreductase subunit M [Kingella kingae]
MFFNNLLSLAIWVPILAGVLVLATGTDDRAPLARILALIGAVAGFLVTLPLFTHFDRANAGYQFTELHAWIPALNLNYALGVDGISVLFVILNAFITLMVVLAGWEVIQKRPAQYMAAFLIMSGLINGAFAAQDAILFYVFFEAMLIPLYLIVGMWGGPRRVYAAMKLFLYTLLGSLLMLVALIYLGTQANSFAITDLQNLKQIPMGAQQLVFIAFFLSFAVKVPMFPVHTWLPDAHVEAPTGGSMVLAAITLKIGAYGFLRFVLPIVPDASRYFAPVIIVLSLIAVIYIGMVALVQTDMKKLVAYSSISHMGFVTLGIFLFSGMFSGQLGELNDWGLKGAIVQMISHGFVSAAMFMCIGVMYDRLHTRNIADYGGVVNVMPKFAAFMMLFGMANAGLPATSGFVGEFMVIMGAVEVNLWIGALAALTLIYGASYTLWMYKRTIFGEITNPHVAEMKDINCREFAILAILAAAVLGMGLYPEAFIAVVHQAADNLIAQVAQSKI